MIKRVLCLFDATSVQLRSLDWTLGHIWHFKQDLFSQLQKFVVSGPCPLITLSLAHAGPSQLRHVEEITRRLVTSTLQIVCGKKKSILIEVLITNDLDLGVEPSSNSVNLIHIDEITI